jgi:hypothetical protein
VSAPVEQELTVEERLYRIERAIGALGSSWVGPSLRNRSPELGEMVDRFVREEDERAAAEAALDPHGRRFRGGAHV